MIDDDFVILEYVGSVVKKVVGNYTFEKGVPVPVLRKDAIVILGKSTGVNFRLVDCKEVVKDNVTITDIVEEEKPKFLIVSFYTKRTPYEEEVEKLRHSLIKLNLPFYIEAVESRGSWVKNCNIKAEFCKRMLLKYEVPIIWVDCDAEIIKFPELFYNLDEYDVAVATSHKPARPNEILSGTLFFNNTPGAITTLDAWIEECEMNPNKWDQRNLQKVLSEAKDIKMFDLPPSYVKIFDNKSTLDYDTIIIHNQASRRLKRRIT